MADTPHVTAGPAIAASVQEVRGFFPSDATLQDAIAKLTHAGFDRAELSLPEAEPPPSRATPEQGAANPNTETDDRQIRTLQTSMAGTVGAIAAAGAVLMTGGAAVPAAAAAALGGVGLGVLANAASAASNTSQREAREDAAARDLLVLSARVGNSDRQQIAGTLMREAGATRVHHVDRVPKRATIASTG